MVADSVFIGHAEKALLHLIFMRIVSILIVVIDEETKEKIWILHFLRF
jgi:hypothetical protein